MAKTLADMKPKERPGCRGMWCDVETPIGTEMVIYHPSQLTNEKTLLNPGYGHFEAELSKITPRFDLPRAWNPDGTPVIVDVQTAEYRPGANRGFYTVHETTEKGPELPENTTQAQRWVGEWEAIPND